MEYCFMKRTYQIANINLWFIQSTFPFYPQFLFSSDNKTLLSSFIRMFEVSQFINVISICSSISIQLNFRSLSFIHMYLTFLTPVRTCSSTSTLLTLRICFICVCVCVCVCHTRILLVITFYPYHLKIEEQKHIHKHITYLPKSVLQNMILYLSVRFLKLK